MEASGLGVRVIAVRSLERQSKQLYLWDDAELTVQAFLTTDMRGDADDLAHHYDGRAGVEPLIGDLKGAWGIGKVPSADFEANHGNPAALLSSSGSRRAPTVLRVRGRCAHVWI